MFFALSGYWISNMWEAKYSRADAPYATYVLSRYWRLAPMFLLASLLTVVCAPLTHSRITWDLPTIASSVGFLGYAWLPDRPVGPAWSLDIEMQFYLVAPVLLWAARRAGAVSAVLVAAAVSAMAAIAMRVELLPAYLVFFVAGIVAAQSRWRPTSREIGVPIALIGVASLALLVSPFHSLIIVGAHPGPWSAYNGAYDVALALAFIPWAIASTHRKGGASDKMFADLSYAVYLFHWIGVEWLNHATAGKGHVERLTYIAALFVLVMVVSWLAWKVVDQPLNRMRSEWLSRRIQSAKPDATTLSVAA